MQTRMMVCEVCGGDRGFDVPWDINRHNGDAITRWVECPHCCGTGEEEIDLQPIEIEDLDNWQPLHDIVQKVVNGLLSDENGRGGYS